MEDKNVELGAIAARSTSSVDIPHARSRGNTSRDDQEMAYFGKRQQLKRNFGFLSIAGFVCSLLSTWEGMFAVFLYGFQNGGPAGLVYGYIFCFFGTLCTVASLAEMSRCSYKLSMESVIYLTEELRMPLSGGQYHWVSILAPKSHAKFLSYMTGWLTVIDGKQSTLHLTGKQVMSLLRLSNGGGWSSDGTSFFIGLITSVFSFLGADSACHMSEEIHNASTVVPWAMISTIILNGILGFALLIALLFCLGDINDALNSPTGFPFIEIFKQATNSNAAATGMTCIILIILFAAAIGIMATASRLLWSFARDNGVPGSAYISRVHEPTALPIYSILVSAVISLLLALINIGSTAAFNSIVSVNVAAFFTSYMIPIVLILKKRLRKDPLKDKIHWGPWKNGSNTWSDRQYRRAYLLDDHYVLQLLA
ncbi:hypothetical protein DID88_003513 [Monilinia fructigena]|uniref:Amino acid permease/ SLC12A domain-containing protein n=1 Tax=Monilinia fructigena TaxID=38457 RepID=A0A395IU79_9HELO|nr:hypothetical protein DID88_003513 [Monilinia fructigena]